jgi:hypothetical protein
VVVKQLPPGTVKPSSCPRLLVVVSSKRKQKQKQLGQQLEDSEHKHKGNEMMQHIKNEYN